MSSQMQTDSSEAPGRWFRIGVGPLLFLLVELFFRPDPALAKEREMVFALETTLARLSGHLGEGDAAVRAVAGHLGRRELDPVTGLPVRP